MVLEKLEENAMAMAGAASVKRSTYPKEYHGK